MNQPATPAHGTDAFLARYQGLRTRLPGNPAQRDTAAAAFEAAGLPTTRNEAWHYTSLRSLGDVAFQEPLATLSTAPRLPNLGPDLAAGLPRIVLLDGRYQPGLSTPPASLGITTFSDHPDIIHPDPTTPTITPPGTPPGTTPGSRAPTPPAMPMLALNTMLAEDGIQLHVPENSDAGLVLLLALTQESHRPIDIHPRHRIRLEPGARLTILEITRGEGTYLHNAVTEIDVARGATLTHIRLQQESLAATHINTTLATIAEAATYDTFVLTLGARLARTEIHARLQGPRAQVHLNGAQLLDGAQHADITTVVQHDAPNCASRQTVKNVLGGRARGVFQGRIEVARPAQKTDGYQMSQALLLSPHAEVDFKPQLEIYADDVKCSHGATVGELDADQLFYLRSRGIPETEARAILVRAFLDGALDVVHNPTARSTLEAAIDTWWEHRA